MRALGILSLFVLFPAATGSAQQFLVAIPDVVVQPGATEVTIPLTIHDLAGIGDFGGANLVVEVDSPYVEYAGYTMLSPGFHGDAVSGTTIIVSGIHGPHSPGECPETEVPLVYLELTYALLDPPPGVIAVNFGSAVFDFSSEEQVTSMFGCSETSEFDLELQGGSIMVGRPFMRGDVDNDGTIGVEDIQVLNHYLFLGGAAASCVDAMDTNADGTLTLSDPLVLVYFAFLGGAPPSAPFPGCEFGLDSGLTCDEFACP